MAATFEQMQQFIEHLKQAILTYSEYLELFDAIGVKLRKTRDMQVVDETL